MWPFTRKPRRAPRLNGIFENLWSYDVRHHQGWRLDTDAMPRASRQPSRRKNLPRRMRQREKLTHYIGAGGMRHEDRRTRMRAHAQKRPDAIWKLFALFILIWLIGRWLPV
jgi:hypothetical protein